MAKVKRQFRSDRRHAHARGGRPAARRGFTLLEVMVSLGILAVALIALGDMNGGAARMHSYATKLTIAVQLARGKLLDVKQLLIKDGLSDYSKEYRGTFDDEGWPEFSWRAQVIKPDFEADGVRALNGVTSSLGLNPTDISSLLGNIPGLGALTGGAGGSAPSTGSLAPGATTDPTQALAALGPIGGLIDGQLKTLSQQVKDSVREIKLTVSWKSTATTEESFDVVEHIIQLPDASQEQQANAQSGAPTTGLPGQSGQQIYNGSGLQNANAPPIPGSLGGGLSIPPGGIPSVGR
jgi:general secretion pathway protein I